jgi:hypothetical protein
MTAPDRPPFIFDRRMRLLRHTADPRQFFHPRFFRSVRYIASPIPDKTEDSTVWRPIDREDILAWFRTGAEPGRMLLAADPGMGVTTNLQWLHAQLNAPGSNVLAFLVDATELPEDLDGLLTTTLVAQLRLAPGNDSHSVPQEKATALLERLRSQRRLVLLIDHLDPSQDEVKTRLHTLKRLLRDPRWRLCGLVLGGRRRTFERFGTEILGDTSAAAWRFLSLHEFEPDQQRRYLGPERAALVPDDAWRLLANPCVLKEWRGLPTAQSRSIRDVGDAYGCVQRLMLNLNDVRWRLGQMRDVPVPPRHHLLRADVLDALKEKILIGSGRPVGVTGVAAMLGVQGMGGIGKSVLAAILARDWEMRLTFPDGMLWISLGQTPTLTLRQKQLAEALGDFSSTFIDEQGGKSHLDGLLATKQCLVILDDVWDLAHVEAFGKLGQECQLLITTRDGGLIKALEADPFSLDVLSDDQALHLLAEWSRQAASSLPAVALQVASECGNLPLALAMVGAMKHDRDVSWKDLLDLLLDADLAEIEADFPGYYPNLLRALQVSVEALDPQIKQRYLDLAVFPEDVAIPEAALGTFWRVKRVILKKTIQILIDRSLARRDDDGRISLHDLQRDYIRKQVDDLPGLHNRLLAAYEAKCPDGWPGGPDDGYFFQRLPHHLVAARRADELRNLLLDFRWLEAKLEATDVAELIGDYALWLSQSVGHEHGPSTSILHPVG